MGAAPRPPERERVRVVCRVRPFTARERAVSLGACLASAAAARTSVTARDPVDGTRHAFSFDEVFTAHGDEARGAGAADSPAGGGGGGGGGNSRAPAAIYARHGRPLVAAAARGFNCTALCYGQTGSGKTACMFGVEECAGLVPQVRMRGGRGRTRKRKLERKDKGRRGWLCLLGGDCARDAAPLAPLLCMRGVLGSTPALVKQRVPNLRAGTPSGRQQPAVDVTSTEVVGGVAEALYARPRGAALTETGGGR